MPAGSLPESGTTSVVAYVPNLMDRSRVEIAGAAAGLSVEFVSGPTDLVTAVEHGTQFVVIDLAHAGVLEVLPLLGAAHTLGFASHVDKPLLDAARAAGCDEVVPRSAVLRRLARAGDRSQPVDSPATGVTSTATSNVCEVPPPSTEPRKGDTSQ
jgi:hypothetical protein